MARWGDGLGGEGHSKTVRLDISEWPSPPKPCPLAIAAATPRPPTATGKGCGHNSRPPVAGHPNIVVGWGFFRGCGRGVLLGFGADHGQRNHRYGTGLRPHAAAPAWLRKIRSGARLRPRVAALAGLQGCLEHRETPLETSRSMVRSQTV
ncbi:hypothetical protein GCM10010437_055200 [Actinoplanes palleronii]